MKVIIKPYTQDTKGCHLISDIYEVESIGIDTVTIIDRTMNGDKLYEIDKSRILKVID